MKAHLTKRLVCLILEIVLCPSAAVITALAANDTKNVKVKVKKVSTDTVHTQMHTEGQEGKEDTRRNQAVADEMRVYNGVKVE